MKVSPLAQGTGVPAQSDSSLGHTADATKLARAKAIASGETVAEKPQQSSGDPQVDRIQTRRIKMHVQRSTNRHEFQPDNTVNTVSEPEGEEPQRAAADTTEPIGEPEAIRTIDPDKAAIIKAKRALQVKERELEQREEALKAQSSQTPPKDEGEYISKADLIANPLKVFEAGVTYDQLTEAILASQNQPIDTQKLRTEIREDLKKELLGELNTRDQQAESQVLAQIKRDSLALTANDEKFEAIREARARNHPDFANGKDPVTDLIHRQYKATGEIMDVADAAEAIENQLIEEALPYTKLKKVQTRLQPQEIPAQQVSAPVARPGTKVMRTLTNRDSSAAPLDKRSRAIAAMLGTLKR